MDEASKRIIEEGEYIYVIDSKYVGYFECAFVFSAKIIEVDENFESFVARFCTSYILRRYLIKDYKHLFYSTLEEAESAVNKLPKPGMIIYQKIGKRVYKKTVTDVCGLFDEEVNYDIYICLNRGEPVSISEMGKTIFLNESDARK